MCESSDNRDCGPDHPVTAIQTDIFCGSCGANLYGRPVWRTVDTHLLVVTCPRCGKLAPASEAMPYRRVWRQRLGLTLSLSWIMLLLGAFVACVSIEASLQAETPSYSRRADGRRVYLDREATQRTLAYTGPISLGAGFAAGCLLACALYHWKRRWHIFAAMIVPMVATGFVALAAVGSEYRQLRLSNAFGVFLLVMAIQALGGILGVCVGRPVGRALVRALLPNHTRKFFAFLWRRDGKEMPLGPF